MNTTELDTQRCQQPRTEPPAVGRAVALSAAAAPLGDRVEEKPAEPSGEWHTEANVQASLVTALAAGGWRILSVANTATKEHGIDVIASRDGQTVGVE